MTPIPWLAALLAFASVAGCSEMTSPDQCLRREIFRQCLHELPTGPTSTHYNDWSEVVNSCASTAYYQSLRKRSQIDEECRA